jgi:hypothetical protein
VLVEVLKKNFYRWEFAYVESFGLFGRLIIGWNSSLTLLKSFSICPWINMESQVKKSIILLL